MNRPHALARLALLIIAAGTLTAACGNSTPTSVVQDPATTTAPQAESAVTVVAPTTTTVQEQAAATLCSRLPVLRDAELKRELIVESGQLEDYMVEPLASSSDSCYLYTYSSGDPANGVDGNGPVLVAAFDVVEEAVATALRDKHVSNIATASYGDAGPVITVEGAVTYSKYGDGLDAIFSVGKYFVVMLVMDDASGREAVATVMTSLTPG